MSWNYRLMRHSCKEGVCKDEIEYSIHEVYYDKDENVKSWTENSIAISAETKDSTLWVITKMIEALTKDVLDADTGKSVEKGLPLPEELISYLKLPKDLE